MYANMKVSSFVLYVCVFDTHARTLITLTGLKEHFGQCGEILRADVLTEVFRVSEIL
jgi:hypothetical protein